jgi:hypothetical protein
MSCRTATSCTSCTAEVNRPIERVLLGVIGLGFAIGFVTHALDFWWFGWAPYAFGPPALNLFWNSLVALDAAVIVLLLLGQRRWALGLALAIMLGDVAANCYAWAGVGLIEFQPALMAQSGFLGLLLGAVGFLWPRRAAKGTR